MNLSIELEGWLWGNRWWMAKQLQCFLFLWTFKPSLIDNLTSDSYYYINKCLDICFASHGEQIEEIVGKHGLVVISRVGSNPESFIYESDVLTKYIVSLYQLCQFQWYKYFSLEGNFSLIIALTKEKMCICFVVIELFTIDFRN